MVGCKGPALAHLTDLGHKVFGARTLEQAVSLVRDIGADLAVLHVGPRCSVDEVTRVRSLRLASPRCQVIVVADKPTLEMATRLMREGTRDLLMAPIDGRTLLDSVSRLWEAKAWDDSDDEPHSFAAEEAAFAARHGLTQRQADVFHGLLKGQANKEVAADLSIALRTLEDHISGLLRKTGTADVRSLLAFYRSYTRTLLAAPGIPRVGVPDIARSTLAESSFASETQDASARHRSVR